MPNISRRHDEPVEPDIQTTAFTATVEKVYRLDPTSANFDVHLPTASGVGGQDILLYVDYSGLNTVVVTPSGVETVNGVPGIILGTRESVILTSNGIDDWIGFGAP